MLPLPRAAVCLAAYRAVICSVLALTFLVLPLCASADRTASVTISGGGCTLPSGTSFAIKAYAANGGHLKSDTATASGGTTSVSKSVTQLSSEMYTISVKGSKWLRKNATVDLRGSDNPVSLTLLGGDANNDNVVDINDLNLLVSHYNQTYPASGYSDACDFNCDGSNDITDLNIIVANYNKTGDPDPIPPLSGFSLSTTQTTGGNVIQATITLTTTAPSGGKTVLLRSTPENAFTVSGTTNNVVTFTSGQQTKTVDLNTATVTYPTHLLVIAECESSTISDAVTLTPVTLRITNIGLNKVTLEWPATNLNGQTGYRLVRTVGTNSTNLDTTSTTYEDSVSWTTSTDYKYELFALVSSTPTYLATEKARFFSDTVTDNQVVDSRQDTRNSDLTYVDFKFNTSVYKGGLFAGYAKGNNDQSHTGRSLLKFTLPDATNPGTSSPYYNLAFRTASMTAHFVDFERRGGNVVSSTTFPFDIYCQLTDSTWSPSEVKWTTAPLLNEQLITSQERKWQFTSATTPGTWAAWEMSQAVIGAMRGSSHSLGFMLYNKQPIGSIGTANEGGSGWAYFAKKEYDNSKAARVLHAWTYPTPYQFEYGGLTNGTAHCGQAFTVGVILNGLGVGDPGIIVQYSITYLNDSGVMSDNIVVTGSATVTALNRTLITDSPRVGNFHSMYVTASCNGVTIGATVGLGQ